MTTQTQHAGPEERTELIRLLIDLSKGYDLIDQQQVGKSLRLAAALLAADSKAGGEVVEWADKAMELATDFAVDSLRVGSYERKDVYENGSVATWQTVQLREKREQSRERLRQYLYTHPQPQSK